MDPIKTHRRPKWLHRSGVISFFPPLVTYNLLHYNLCIKVKAWGTAVPSFNLTIVSEKTETEGKKRKLRQKPERDTGKASTSVAWRRTRNNVAIHRKPCIWSKQATAWQFNIPHSKNSQNYTVAGRIHQQTLFSTLGFKWNQQKSLCFSVREPQFVFSRGSRRLLVA